MIAYGPLLPSAPRAWLSVNVLPATSNVPKLATPPPSASPVVDRYCDAGGTDRPVVGHDDVVERQVALIQDAAAEAPGEARARDSSASPSVIVSPAMVTVVPE